MTTISTYVNLGAILAETHKRTDAWVQRENKRLSDPNIWQTLPHGGAIKRRYLFTGKPSGIKCEFEVELGEQNANNPDYYTCHAVCAHNCWYAPDWVRLSDLTPL